MQGEAGQDRVLSKRQRMWPGVVGGDRDKGLWLGTEGDWGPRGVRRPWLGLSRTSQVLHRIGPSPPPPAPATLAKRLNL